MFKYALIGIVFVFLLFSFLKNITEYQKNVKFHDTFKSDFDKEKEKNNQLKMQLVQKTDPKQLEKTIRNNLNLTKEGEVAIIVPTPTLEPIIITPTPEPVYKQWVNVFF